MGPETMGCSDRRDFSALMSVSQAVGGEAYLVHPFLELQHNFLKGCSGSPSGSSSFVNL